jgi:cysteine desulfuration protein SufE
MLVSEKVEKLVDHFNSHKDWEDKYKILIKMGKGLASLNSDDQLTKYEIKGCQSKVWLKPKLADGKVFFSADSDAILVKGIIAILLDVYSDSSPQDILENPPEFLTVIGISDHLSLNRTNGLRAMVKQIQTYASLFNALIAKGVTSADI